MKERLKETINVGNPKDSYLSNITYRQAIGHHLASGIRRDPSEDGKTNGNYKRWIFQGF